MSQNVSSGQETHVARPSSFRNQLKEDARKQILAPKWNSFRDEAHQIYEENLKKE